MLFEFLKYVSPVNYFNLRRNDGSSIFPVWKELPKGVKDKVIFDEGYSSEEMSQRDASWQALNKGYVGDARTYTFGRKTPIEDEYRFIGKYFKSFWLHYILVLRILFFNNPVREYRAFFKAKKIRKIDLNKKLVDHSTWKSFPSNLLDSNPQVSIIIPTLNRYEYLKDVLRDLENQEYKNIEVLVVDQTDDFKKEFYDDYSLDLKVIYQEEKALWLARNRAVQMSRGDYVLLFDDDSRVDKDWVANHLRCVDFFNAPISSGVSISKIGDRVPESYTYFKISSQIDTGNVMIHKAVFKEIGLFDRQFEKQRMGDGEFGLRAFLAGFKNISNPYAKRLHLKVGTGGLRQMGSWDAMRPTKLIAPRPIPSVLYLYRKYYGKVLTRYALAISIPPSVMPYRFKANKKALILGSFLSVLVAPIILLQVIKSWNLASKKLNEGALISEL